MTKILRRPELLTSEQIETFFAPPEKGGRLAYRCTMLFKHSDLYELETRGFPVPTWAMTAALEASFIAGRMLLEFIGLTATTPDRLEEAREYKTPDEVKIIDIGGSYVELTSLSPGQRRMLASFYYQAQSNTAHLTLDHQDAHLIRQLHATIKLIDDLLNTHLHDHAIPHRVPFRNEISSTFCALFAANGQSPAAGVTLQATEIPSIPPAKPTIPFTALAAAF